MILKISRVIGLSFLTTFHSLNASEFNNSQDYTTSSPLHLPVNRYKEVIESLNQAQMIEKQTMEPGHSISPTVSLSLKSITEREKGLSREIRLRIDCLSSDFPEMERSLKKQRFTTYQPAWINVGKMILKENVAPPTDQGSIHVEFIHVFDEFQGQGIGGLALTQLKTMAQKLANKSPYYQTITLLSQDVEYKNKQLVSVPRRVKFYMDNGFTFDDKTKKLIKFLSIKHFIHQLDTEQLAEYMKEYILPEKVEGLAGKVGRYILPALKKSEKFPDIPFEQLVQLVQTDGSRCATHILDRAFYWGNGVTDEQQATFPQYVYLMRYHLSSQGTDSADSEVKFRKNLMSKDQLTQALTETAGRKERFLLPDQNALNDEIYHLLLTPETYVQLKGNKIVAKLKKYLTQIEHENGNSSDEEE